MQGSTAAARRVARSAMAMSWIDWLKLLLAPSWIASWVELALEPTHSSKWPAECPHPPPRSAREALDIHGPWEATIYEPWVGDARTRMCVATRARV